MQSSLPPGVASASSRESAEGPFSDGDPLFDAWNVEEELRHVDRILKADKKRILQRRAATESGERRIDASHLSFESQYPPVVAVETQKEDQDKETGTVLLGFFTWLCLLLGTAATAGGGVLLGWSASGKQPDLWNIGIPCTIGGTIALLIGLIFQLERLWTQYRLAASQLQEVHRELHVLKRTTELLGAHPTSTSSAFYAHYAGGADPELLLSDLKSQLDMLTLRLGKR